MDFTQKFTLKWSYTVTEDHLSTTTVPIITSHVEPSHVEKQQIINSVAKFPYHSGTLIISLFSIAMIVYYGI